MTKSPYDLFGTDPKLETAGIRVEYGSFYFILARAGGANDAFRNLVREKVRPYQRAIDLGEMDEKVAEKLTGDAFAEAIVIGWGSTEFGEGKIPGPDGKPITFSIDAAKALFKDLPELLQDLQKQATDPANFRKKVNGDDAKN